MRGPSAKQVLPRFVALGHLHREIIATSGSLLWGNGANTCQLAYLRRHFHSPEAVTLRRRIALLACVAHRAKQVCQVSVALGHLHREIIATSGSYYGVTGPILPVSVPSATLSPEAVTLRRHIALLACVAHRPNKSAKIRRSGSPTSRDNRDFRLLLWGNGGQYVPVSVPSATLSPEAVTLRRHIALWHAWPIGPNKSAKISSLWVTYIER
ncbi:hypothetical protein DPMN_001851 [Dreissena polymorpha]|uniref:Uncharacterized protein n=1 Tax=Dreissena polymorpha TaxID=45954 RepID=A0A9D4MI09_DREPO|nr:hypothetical protein DPMN_001851 [Dreissena polymorpha]